MTDRSPLKHSFLAQTDWATAARAPLAGDASNRKYDRLTLDGRNAVLMDAPPEKGEDVRPFIAITTHLRALGLRAPEILASDEENGFLLLEDLGDDLFARVLERAPEQEETLYKAATDVLVTLHQSSPPTDIAPYSPKVMADMAALAYSWYVLGLTDNELPEQETTFHGEIETVLAQYCPDQSVLIQRDYHAENLLWLPDQSGTDRVGLLDYQDAMSGHPAYDLVSVLQDARRDVSPHIETQMIQYYVDQTGADKTAFTTAYAVLGAQRNLRILGVFARLAIASGKCGYIDLIERVWGLLLRNLDHPALKTISDLVLADLPRPTPENLQRLRDKCARTQQPS